MELVKGIPITKFCDERRLTLRERLELAIPVCQAVQHAHQKGIIHRDLKPSNVLIALYDGKPVPKIIDFGVAKATGPRLTDQTLYTEFGAVVGTLEYMSPEQAELNQLDIDTRSDIYSLGVLLYELLTGSTPLEHKRLKQAVFLELLRVIREEESPRPSLRLSTTEELPSIAACRHIEPRKLSGLVRGELDWIVMKALEKDRNRRYETANGLAADLRRYLNDEPVQAVPADGGLPSEQVRQEVSCSSGDGMRVRCRADCSRGDQPLAGGPCQSSQSRGGRGLRRRDQATPRGAGSTRSGIEGRGSGRGQPGPRPRRRRRLPDDNQREPTAQVAPARPSTSSQGAAGHSPEILRGIRAAATRTTPACEPTWPRPRLRVGEITDEIGSKEEALKAFQTASDLYESLARATTSPSNRPYRAGQARCLMRMAMIKAKNVQSDESLGLFERSIALLNQLEHDQPGDSHIRADLAVAHHYLATYLQQHGNLPGAILHKRAAIDLRKSLAQDFPNQFSHRIDLALSLSNLGGALKLSGRPAEAFESVRAANTLQRTLAKEHPEESQLRHHLALSTRGMAALLRDIGRWKESRPLYAESEEIMARVVSDNPAVTEYRRAPATGACEFGQQLIDNDEPVAGLNALERARDQSEMVKRMNPSDIMNLNTLASIHRGIGKVRSIQGKSTEALDSLRQAIAIGEQIAVSDGLLTYDLACGLALYARSAVCPARPGEDSNNPSQQYSDKAMDVCGKPSIVASGTQT